jgi:hypothetical protein
MVYGSWSNVPLMVRIYGSELMVLSFRVYGLGFWMKR